MSPGFLSTAIPLALFFVSGAWAQVEMAKCDPGWEWNQNSLGQDACSIGSSLDAACRGLVTYTYPPINSTQYYIPPDATHDGDLTCDCNTVMYSLYMACTACQGGIVYSWKMWTTACDKVYVTQYPGNIPQGSAVPRWAFFDVTTLPNQTYTDANAMSIGRNPEELPKPINTVVTDDSSTSTGKNTISRTSSRTSSGTPRPTNVSSSTSKKRTNVGAVVGGVVGTVVPLSIIAVVLFFYRQRQQQQQQQQKLAEQQQQPPQSPGMEPYPPQTPSMYGPPASAVPFTQYNPADPSTFPPQSPPTSVTYTTNPSYNNTRGNYSGIPEV